MIVIVKLGDQTYAWDVEAGTYTSVVPGTLEDASQFLDRAEAGRLHRVASALEAVE